MVIELYQVVVVILTIFGSVFGLVKVMVARHVKEVDEMAQRITRLEHKTVPRNEIDQRFKDIEQEIKDGNRITHARLDKILEWMMKDK